MPMKLYATLNNPPPPGAVVSAITTKDGIALRVARWTAGPTSRGTVVVLPGRAEFIEKYFETVGELLERRFDVVVMDWRGQGLSQRQLSNRSKGHIDDFDIYQLDLAALADNVLGPFCSKPWFALGHSMAGAILIAQAHAGCSPFARIVMTAPMIAVAELRLKKAAELLAEGLDILGFGGAYIPGGGNMPIYLRPFAGNPLTSSEARYRRTAAIIRAAPDVAIGHPTVGWTNAAFHLMRQFEDADYPRRTLTPILVIAAGADRIVSTPATESFASRLKVGKIITLPYARHEILMEHDQFRAQFWAAFDGFIPGLDDRLAQSVTAAMNAPRRKTRRFWPWQSAAAQNIIAHARRKFSMKIKP
ncbi:alpha/beta fold hydrolase [Methylovirgula sp. HY1]|uniref:alpha/beta fold hydrolase n=1 Tax=Methylovirgula sp. HY1 TaxID=2822761 RepID=UPI0021049F5B|nr:alpha/beta hydrolase [Methylovirgula sp. HY1]